LKLGVREGGDDAVKMNVYQRNTLTFSKYFLPALMLFNKEEGGGEGGR